MTVNKLQKVCQTLDRLEADLRGIEATIAGIRRAIRAEVGYGAQDHDIDSPAVLAIFEEPR